MITPNQIREKRISTVSSDGYDRNEVNELLVEIIESYEAVCEENRELYRKMEILANRIEEYRADEDSIKTAIISAQKMADQVTANAKEKAEKALSESAASAQQTVQDAKAKAEQIVSEAREYVANFTKEKADIAEKIVADAQEKANVTISSAKIVADDTIAKAKDLTSQLIEKAKAETEQHRDMMDKIKEESKSFRSTLVGLYEAQLSKLKDIANAGDIATSDLESELDSVISGIDNATPVEPVAFTEPKAYEKESVEEIEEEAEEEIEEIPEIEEIDEPQEAEDSIDQINLMDAPEEDTYEPPTRQEVENALNAFTQDEITPVEDDSNSIPVIDDEAELEGGMPFEDFFNVDKVNPMTDETISLTAPDEDDDEEDNSKFKGFFKKKK